MDPKSTISILIVEDEPDIASFLVHLLNKGLKGNADVAKDGQAALEFSKNKTYDLIFTDYRMPKMTGGAFIKSVRNTENPNQFTPIIVLSAYNNEAKVEVETFPNVYFVDKPSRIDFLIRFSKSVLSQQIKSKKAA